ncbi:NAD-dependent succinate-semialdehyde dehydrogenase [Phaeodactylibacter luteus]|uniref:NAD-dependent succinate-semialdehyde dehydrogenase n=1 Tax=Phaeodactylibacter luteus TaxID=1564516 RepID=A0A5C6S518_9BACT|nr:NAD-dependent succinate-semialdehyde dehydrogenase [Phaeodactylibacter luteus]TXB68901.1 NAD-dependent succinate-semialdehyde dehydrogenase [Phaeodactylibacter luteus]
MQQAIDPATGDTISSYEELGNKMLNKAIVAADTAYQDWQLVALDEKARKLRNAARVLEEEKEALSMLITREMGKPIKAAQAEIEKCAWTCLYYAQNAERFLRDEFVVTDAAKSYIAYRPIGPLLAIMPWNFPFWQVFRFAAPNLMAGNTILLKHAPNVPGCALAIASIFEKAGYPKGVFNSLLIPQKKVKRLIKNRLVRGVTLTGSVGAGRAVAAEAGKALKKTVLELGGSDPYLILEDADIAKAARTCAQSRLLNNGQSCIGAKRFIVLEPVYKDFLDAFRAEMGKAVLGDPLEQQTTLGPLARADLREQLHSQVKQSRKKGAKIILGGKKAKGKGYYYPPTILAGVQRGMPAYHEELFGPVASVMKAQNEREAVRLANDTLFGLGAGIFTQDLERGERLAREHLQAGSCFVNEMVKSDPRLPFGGIKNSGYGRELSHYGLREFTNPKTVYIE